MFYLCQTDVPSHLCKCATVRPFICLSVKKKKEKRQLLEISLLECVTSVCLRIK